jgi:hypothetical protein
MMRPMESFRAINIGKEQKNLSNLPAEIFLGSLLVSYLYRLDVNGRILVIYNCKIGKGIEIWS